MRIRIMADSRYGTTAPAKKQEAIISISTLTWFAIISENSRIQKISSPSIATLRSAPYKLHKETAKAMTAEYNTILRWRTRPVTYNSSYTPTASSSPHTTAATIGGATRATRISTGIRTAAVIIRFFMNYAPPNRRLRR